MITVNKPGMQMTIQDLGRNGYRHIGVARSGALDPYAMIIANRLLNNPDNTPVIEITLGLAQLTFTTDCVVALTGADMKATLANSPLAPGWTYQIKAGQKLCFATSRSGFRAYLAVKGGIVCSPTMGSCATDVAAQFGGLTGRALQAGDHIPITPYNGIWSQRGAISPAARQHIRVHSSPHKHLLTEQSLTAFCQTTWHISPNSNRMGLRLTNQACDLTHIRSLPSLAVGPGSIQLPPSGEPIVLLNDAQTTGGYPLLGTVISADLHQFAQLKPGDTVKFSYVDLAVAAQAQSKLNAHLQQLKLALNTLKIKR
ncbi:biotin-dependent carboxyltransferase family protein [Pseudoalteromonas sp. NEC-BIFX-2020_015]|uniref:5-oxoprolinase subunit C family protein n=1 Tax=Pseudoalteromonas sp. NEC-BIFX-2020_015 TaxID=2729544 RepID=UPI0014613CD9|nr:biotin-dependent carboxyltransferase family protein [Pseudoalteromonas sp. NEC-BIFX-2020_015]NMR24121.1 biotin-dependent carboxyltransferase family protein [Pseudoalteromonas sp. NEC-BIFX-2020_015]